MKSLMSIVLLMILINISLADNVVKKFADGSLKIASKYGEDKDLIITFKPFPYNEIWTYQKVELVDNNSPLIDTTFSIEGIPIMACGSDNIGPYSISSIDGEGAGKIGRAHNFECSINSMSEYYDDSANELTLRDASDFPDEDGIVIKTGINPYIFGYRFKYSGKSGNTLLNIEPYPHSSSLIQDNW